ncbi:uncharacterized, partial [Tachysurus ichikawai]
MFSLTGMVKCASEVKAEVKMLDMAPDAVDDD